MLKSVRRLTIALALLAALALPAPAAAQQSDPAPFTIVFDKSITSLVNYEVIRAFMGVTECGSLDLT